MTNYSQSLIYMMFVVVYVFTELPDLLEKMEALSGPMEGVSQRSATLPEAATNVAQKQVKNLLPPTKKLKSF